MTVLVGSRDLGRGEQAAEALRGVGADVRAMKLDVTSEADRVAAAEFIRREFGRLDVLINNAAVNLDQGAGYETSTTPVETIRETFETNFFAVVDLTQRLLPLIRKSAAGRIVNVSSAQGSLAQLAPKGSPIYATKTFSYDASKTALNSFTLHLAHELRGTKIKVNSIHPGWVRTDMGGELAPLDLVEGARTSVRLATLGEDGPTGGYFHMDLALPW
jgi:NAD(P)-dependent dehydrogenase (short-subunit alcohol dehydrogenase family)